MTTKAKLVECVCVWLDETSDPGEPCWIISHDKLNERGEAEASDTISGLPADRYTEAQAVEDAKLEGAELGLPVYHQGRAVTGRGFPPLVWEPAKVVTIRDGIGHMRQVLRLTGDTLTGGDRTVGILRRNGCEVSVRMADDEIAEAVRDAWSGEGYEGDPGENGLTVTVEAE